MKKLKLYIGAIIGTAIPGVLTYLGSSSSFLNNLQKRGIIGEGINVNSMKEACTSLSIIFTFFLITVNTIRIQSKANEYKEQRNNLLNMTKTVFEKAFSEIFNREEINLNIRIYVPKKTLIWKIMHKLGMAVKLEFVVRNINGLAEPGLTNGLKFEVEPNTVGLVGECYKTRGMLYDDDLEHSNNTDYDLKMYQIDKTSNLKFSLVCPIYNERDEIISILALDSTSTLKVSNDKKNDIINSVTNFKQMLVNYIPELFKSQGGIL